MDDEIQNKVGTISGCTARQNRKRCSAGANHSCITILSDVAHN